LYPPWLRAPSPDHTHFSPHLQRQIATADDRRPVVRIADLVSTQWFPQLATRAHYSVVRISGLGVQVPQRRTIGAGRRPAVWRSSLREGHHTRYCLILSHPPPIPTRTVGSPKDHLERLSSPRVDGLAAHVDILGHGGSGTAQPIRAQPGRGGLPRPATWPMSSGSCGTWPGCSRRGPTPSPADGRGRFVQAAEDRTGRSRATLNWAMIDQKAEMPRA
jgi:hypothetical protein